MERTEIDNIEDQLNSNKDKTDKRTDTTRGCTFFDCRKHNIGAMASCGSHKLEVYDWLKDTPNPLINNDVIEVRFKNTRKSYFRNPNRLDISKNDIVVVESSPGLDVGIVSLTGDLVAYQMQKHRFTPENGIYKNIIRKATCEDIQNWQEAIALEYETMIQSRKISENLGLDMKIGDVEYQSDKLKAIFYYIADERVDFRELIKVLAERFRIRVEMKQIGARQEAGRIGGIGSCGRELCCASWHNSFHSVTITSARHQDISLNPQKLAGQCGKLKCCLNYEADNYIDARKSMPKVHEPLRAQDADYYLVKSDIFKQIMWFSPDPNSTMVSIPLSADKVREVIMLNKRGEKVERLEDTSLVMHSVENEPAYKDILGEDSLTRFDDDGSNQKKRKKRASSRKRRNDDVSYDSENSNQGQAADNDSSEQSNKEQRQDSNQRRGGRGRGRANRQNAQLKEQEGADNTQKERRKPQDNNPRNRKKQGKDNSLENHSVNVKDNNTDRTASENRKQPKSQKRDQSKINGSGQNNPQPSDNMKQEERPQRQSVKNEISGGQNPNVNRRRRRPSKKRSGENKSED